jgi:hypothetical protein
VLCYFFKLRAMGEGFLELGVHSILINKYY